MNVNEILDKKNKMIYGFKKSRKESALNCLKEYRLVIETYQELEDFTKKLNQETIKSKRIKLFARCLLLSKKIDIVYNKWKKIETYYNSSIPLEANVPASTIFPHQLNNIFISAHSRIGEDCVIFHNVTIGSNTLSDSKNHGSPTIGNNVYIGAGATIIGDITIGDNARIGANVTVTKSVDADTTCVSQPSIHIKHKEKKENHQW